MGYQAPLAKNKYVGNGYKNCVLSMARAVPPLPCCEGKRTLLSIGITTEGFVLDG